MSDDGHTRGKHRGPRFTWNAQYEEIFFRILSESVTKGLRDNTTFKQEAWDLVFAELAKHGARPTKTHLTNKSDNARKKFRTWRGLRENPEFEYHPESRMVSATEDAWQRHIEKDPLSKSMKGRPFEHEEYMEILYGDVVGTAGIAQRKTKARRKTDADTDDPMMSAEPEGNNNSMMDMSMNMDFVGVQYDLDASPQIPQQPHLLSHRTVPSMHQHAIQPMVQSRPNSLTQMPQMVQSIQPMPMDSPGLTPPEEHVTLPTTQQTRKRFSQAAEIPVTNTATPNKRHRMTNGFNSSSSTNDSSHDAFHKSTTHNGAAHNSTATAPVSNGNVANGTNGASRVNGVAATNGTHTVNGVTVPPAAAASASGTSSKESQAVVALLAEALRPVLKPRPTWAEQALEIFFRDFANEDIDLQVTVAQKVLAEETKGMVFVKMPAELRRHWVNRLKDIHNRNITN